MHAGFCTQPAIGVIAADHDGSALNASHLPFGDLGYGDAETPLLSPA